jgi:hypothetical protein
VLFKLRFLGTIMRDHAEVTAFEVVIGDVFHAEVVRASRESHILVCITRDIDLLRSKPTARP